MKHVLKLCCEACIFIRFLIFIKSTGRNVDTTHFQYFVQTIKSRDRRISTPLETPNYLHSCM